MTMLDFLPEGNQDVTLKHAILSSGTAVISAIPNEETKCGLVLIPDIFGLRPLIDETLTQLAQNKIATIAVEPFSHMSENPSQISREEKLTRIKDQDDNLQCADILAAGQILKTQHGCKRVSLIGFCIGGMYAFKCAGTGWFDSVVSCYGMISLPDDWRGPGQREPIDYLQMESCSQTLAIIGGQDHGFAKADDVDTLRNVLNNEHHQSVGSSLMIFEKAGHAFMHDPQREEHRPVDAQQAWKLALDRFFYRESNAGCN